MKTSDLQGAALDWAVATCEGLPIRKDPMGFKTGSEAGYWVWDSAPKGMQTKIGLGYSPSTSWTQGGPILEREFIYVFGHDIVGSAAWSASLRHGRFVEEGPTPLIAVMRAYLASKLGDEIEIPAELA